MLRMELARGGGNIYSNVVPGQDPVHGHMVSYARLGYLLPDKSPRDVFELAIEAMQEPDLRVGYDLPKDPGPTSTKY